MRTSRLPLHSPSDFVRIFMTDSGPPMVELRNVTKCFGNFTAVQDISLTVRRGEFMTFLGPSGCGKTTVLRMIGGFDTPTAGMVLLDGRDVSHDPPYRRDVNQVFQSYALFPHMNVEENIAFGLKMKRLSRSEVVDRVRHVVSLVSLDGLEHRRPAALSGGQRQRVALARAIVCEPKVLLLDEPLSALDANLRRQMQIELKRLQQRLGLTFIFVTHDQEEALSMSDRIAVINKGRIEQLANANEIYHSPRTTFVANFIGEANILEGELTGRDGERLRLRLAGGLDLLLRKPDLPLAAERLLLSVRPERIRIEKQQSRGDSNVFEALIEEAVFQGAMDRLTLRHSSGLQFHAVAPHEAHFARGESVWCSLHPDDIVVVQEE